ncbi:site-specific integrase [Sphaerisporangium album]|uniref:Site-specific integrase n=1 Tax=Sphaerisporangium album TaxID=509200 RepID=A0A367EJJ1_9ACTN|nr:site-specific integrase [Sphaerisporangium album]RCG18221.1 site-specific integrase [Sphaerisporangium album]
MTEQHLPVHVPAPGSVPAAAEEVPRARDPYWVYLDSLTAGDSRRTMRECLDRIAKLINPAAESGAGQPWHLLRYEHTQRIRAMLDEQGPAATYLNKHLNALRRVLEEAWRLGLMSAEDYHRARDVRGAKASRLPAGQHVPPEVVGAILAACDGDTGDTGEREQLTDLVRARTGARDLDALARLEQRGDKPPKSTPWNEVAEQLGYSSGRRAEERYRRLRERYPPGSRPAPNGQTRAIGVRDAALLAVLYTTGVRREEAAGMEYADWDAAARSIRVRGKGNKERLVFVPSDTVARLEAWLAIRGRAPGALFCALKKNGQPRRTGNRLARITGQRVADILIERIAQAAAGRRTPHDFRRTFIGELLDAGVDLATAQAMVGHASPVTTARYDRRPDATRQAAAERVHLPPARPLRP